MSDDLIDPIGGAWLSRTYGIELVMPLVIVSRIGGRRTTQIDNGATTETYVESMRPDPALRGHLTFHLKHEVPHLELLSRLFEHCDPVELTAWVNHEPTGQYARRAGFLYEFLTGRELPISVETGGGYVDALDDEKLVTATKGLEGPTNAGGCATTCLAHARSALSCERLKRLPGICHSTCRHSSMRSQSSSAKSC